MKLFLTALALCLSSMPAAGQSPQQSPLTGAWKLVEVTSMNGVRVTDPQPGLLVFTQKHYSMMRVTGTKARPRYQAGKATDAEKIATFDAFVANSGTYTTQGNVLRTRPLVAKNEYVMSGREQVYEFATSGTTLTLTEKLPGAGNRFTLTRIE